MFFFKLQSVLDYRKNMEGKILSEFSEKKRELERAELSLNNLVAERISLVDELRKMQNKLLPVDDITRYVSYVEQIRNNEKKQKRVLAQVKEESETLRRELLEAVKRSKVMERLKERHTEEYERAAGALEQMNFDEMAVLKFGRREK
jgi:flagellar protein FliJ